MPSPYREIEESTCYLMGRPDASSIDKVDLTSETEEIAHRLNAHNTAIERVEFIMGTYTYLRVELYCYTCIHVHVYILTYIYVYIHTRTYVYIYLVYIHVLTCIYIWYTYTYLRVYIFGIHTRTCIHTYIHTKCIHQ